MHFTVVLSGRVSGLRFNVPQLKKLKEDRGELYPGTWVKFNNGILDTKAEGFSEEEAGVIRQQLEKMQIHGVTLLENEEKEVKAEVTPQKPQLRFGAGQERSK